MKKIMMIWVLGMLAVCLIPANAQSTQEWKSTSSMAGSGSAYAPQVTTVGATGVASMATTTENHSPARIGARRTESQSGRNAGDVTTSSTQSPIGNAALPLTAMALLYAFSAWRRKAKEAA